MLYCCFNVPSVPPAFWVSNIYAGYLAPGTCVVGFIFGAPLLLCYAKPKKEFDVNVQTVLMITISVEPCTTSSFLRSYRFFQQDDPSGRCKSHQIPAHCQLSDNTNTSQHIRTARLQSCSRKGPNIQLGRATATLRNKLRKCKQREKHRKGLITTSSARNSGTVPENNTNKTLTQNNWRG